MRSVREDPPEAVTAKHLLKKPDRMIKNRYRIPPSLKETLEVIRRGVGAVELDERGLDEEN